jgi:putative membrane protein
MRAAAAFAVIAIVAGCARLGPGYSRSAAGGSSAPPMPADEGFLRDIAHQNLAEIASGKLAAEKGHATAVREFGRWMVEEHTALEAQSGELAQAKGLKLPAEPDIEHQAALKRLALMSGESFDRAYLGQMVEDHNSALALLQEAASQAGDAPLRELAEKASLHVAQHLAEARRLAGELVGRAQ